MISWLYCIFCKAYTDTHLEVTEIKRVWLFWFRFEHTQKCKLCGKTNVVHYWRLGVRKPWND